jgi:hypothetical protein
MNVDNNTRLDSIEKNLGDLVKSVDIMVGNTKTIDELHRRVADHDIRLIFIQKAVNKFNTKLIMGAYILIGFSYLGTIAHISNHLTG